MHWSSLEKRSIRWTHLIWWIIHRNRWTFWFHLHRNQHFEWTSQHILIFPFCLCNICYWSVRPSQYPISDIFVAFVSCSSFPFDSRLSACIRNVSYNRKCGLIFVCVESFYGQIWFIDWKCWCRCNMPAQYLCIYQYNVSYLQMRCCRATKKKRDNITKNTGTRISSPGGSSGCVRFFFIFMSWIHEILRTPLPPPNAIFSRLHLVLMMQRVWMCCLCEVSPKYLFAYWHPSRVLFAVGRQLIRMLLVLCI